MITDSRVDCLQIVEEETKEVEIEENRESIVEDYQILNIASVVHFGMSKAFLDMSNVQTSKYPKCPSCP